MSHLGQVKAQRERAVELARDEVRRQALGALAEVERHDPPERVGHRHERPGDGQ